MAIGNLTDTVAAPSNPTSLDAAAVTLNSSADVSPEVLASFVARWSASGAAERANCQPFLAEMCDLIGVPKPEPTKADNSQNAYVFERDVTFHNQDGTTSPGRIDLYKRGCYVLEAKQGSEQLVNADEFQLAAPK